MYLFIAVHIRKFFAFLLISITCHFNIQAQGFEGYYRYPDIHKNTIVFSAEGDIWTVPLTGGLAQRLTTHHEEEVYPSISPDGKTIAFSASYEGPTEVYSMPVSGGLPKRWTFERDRSKVNTWTPDGKIVYSTWAYSKVPDDKLVEIDTKTKTKKVIPLFQAGEASFDATGKTRMLEGSHEYL